MLIAYNIMTVFSIIAWYLIREHHLVYIGRKYISYLSLSIKVFRCNLFLTKFQHLLFINTVLISEYQMVKSNFSISFFSFSGIHQFITQSDTTQWVRALFLSLLFRPYVFDTHRTIQSSLSQS